LPIPHHRDFLIHPLFATQVARNDLGDGNYFDCDMLAIYEVNAEGKITRMAAHWDYEDTMAQLSQLGSD